jgi:hypothetical protein
MKRKQEKLGTRGDALLDGFDVAPHGLASPSGCERPWVGTKEEIAAKLKKEKVHHRLCAGMRHATGDVY